MILFIVSYYINDEYKELLIRAKNREQAIILADSMIKENKLLVRDLKVIEKEHFAMRENI